MFNMQVDFTSLESSEESGELSAIIDKEFLSKIIQDKSEDPKKEDASTSQSPASRAPLFILYENDGIRTDLIAIANFVEESYTKIKDARYKEEFLNQLLTPVRRDPLEMLN
jgi:hypothetical protein